MASISPATFPSPSPTRSDKFSFTKSNFPSRLLQSSNLLSHSLSRVSISNSNFNSNSTICHCRCHPHNNNDTPPENRGWDAAIQEFVSNAIKMFDGYMNQFKGLEEADRSVDTDVDAQEWDWDRWTNHFTEVDDQERIVSLLKSQLTHAIDREDYEDAARFKVAIAAASTNDTVGGVMSRLNKAIEEEHYKDAAFVRDYAGAGLVGWWAGISEDNNDPYGRIIHIGAEHGRYVARSYSPRQLATASAGAPLFEIFLTTDKNGEYKQQAVYLKRRAVPQDLPVASSKSSGRTGSLKSLDPTNDQDYLFTTSIEDAEDGEDREDDSDTAEGSGFDNILRDMIPGVKVKVLKMTTPGKVDRDLISKVVEQIMEEEDDEDEDDDDDDEKDGELESVDTEDEVKGESDEEKNGIEMDGISGIIDVDEENQMAVKVVVGGLVQNLSRGTSQKDLLRVPARLEKKGRLSFSFSIVEDDKRPVSDASEQSPLKKKAKPRAHRSIDHVMLDLAKSIGRGKIPTKVLKDVSELISLTLSQSHNRQPLSGSMTFNRIEIPESRDPLNGLYVGAHGLQTSEVIQLRRKFGQWKEDGSMKEPPNLEFYEYVEAVKVTGDPYVPAGQVAFRAKVGKTYQLPHKGIIPEEFGVIARYRGQGRLAEPGFRNPRWVDGELVILDGKYIKGGPVVGFVYWAPEYHFLVFFNQLRLQQ